MMITRAQGRIDTQLRDTEIRAARSLGVLAIDAAAVALLVGVHTDLSRFLACSYGRLGIAGFGFLWVVWPAKLDSGPDTRAFFETFGGGSRAQHEAADARRPPGRSRSQRPRFATAHERPHIPVVVHPSRRITPRIPRSGDDRSGANNFPNAEDAFPAERNTRAQSCRLRARCRTFTSSAASATASRRSSRPAANPSGARGLSPVRPDLVDSGRHHPAERCDARQSVSSFQSGRPDLNRRPLVSPQRVGADRKVNLLGCREVQRGAALGRSPLRGVWNPLKTPTS